MRAAPLLLRTLLGARASMKCFLAKNSYFIDAGPCDFSTLACVRMIF